jgi:hypothetical protein
VNVGNHFLGATLLHACTLSNIPRMHGVPSM